MGTAVAEVNEQAIRLRAAFGSAARAMPVRHAVAAGEGGAPDHATGRNVRGHGLLVVRYACRRSSSVRSGGHPFNANDNLVNFAGLTLTGYSDTSGAPSAILRR
ncbi:MAG: hypothetical protein E6Q76_08320 [Rhizobium sp.]|nr:MAG: hypothetical protein E6Q76_08320 [Rhizobium sp.]